MKHNLSSINFYIFSRFRLYILQQTTEKQATIICSPSYAIPSLPEICRFQKSEQLTSPGIDCSLELIQSSEKRQFQQVQRKDFLHSLGFAIKKDEVSARKQSLTYSSRLNLLFLSFLFGMQIVSGNVSFRTESSLSPLN